MNNQIGNKINDKTYIPLPPFKGWVLENFPFIEDDFDCLTNYQMLCLMFKKLNEVISNQNQVQELGSELVVLYNALVDAVNSAIKEFETEVTADINQFKIDTNTEISNFETFITGKFNELKDYVDNFFDTNLPQMVSDKLDEMATDGTLENLLNDVAHLTKSYNTYTDLIADSSTFTNGLRLKTLGYYSVNDGGGADYIVTNVSNNTKYQVELSNSLYLELIIKDYINVKQLGAYGDGTHDDTISIQNSIDYASHIIIPNGTFIFSQIDILANKIVEGVGTLKVKDNLCISSSTNYYPIIIRDNSIIQNLTIDGNKLNNTDFLVADSITTMGNNIRILNNKLINVIDSGIMFSETINSICENNYISDSRDCGIYANNNNSGKQMNSIIRNNYIVNAGTSGIALKRGCQFIKVIGNNLIDCLNGITNENASSDTDFSYEFIIKDNNILCNTILGSFGIDTRGGYNCNVENNRIKNYKSSLVIQGSHDINVLNNIINYNSTETATIVNGIILQGRTAVNEYNYCKNINIINNLINMTFLTDSNNFRGINLVNSNDTSKINILNNFIICNNASGIVSGTDIQDLVIKNNVINSNTRAITLQVSALCCDNAVNGTETYTTIQKINKGVHNTYINDRTTEPTKQSYFKDGDIIFNKIGTNATIFAWQYDSTNDAYKTIRFDT